MGSLTFIGHRWTVGTLFADYAKLYSNFRPARKFGALVIENEVIAYKILKFQNAKWF